MIILICRVYQRADNSIGEDDVARGFSIGQALQAVPPFLVIADAGIVGGSKVERRLHAFSDTVSGDWLQASLDEIVSPRSQFFLRQQRDGAGTKGGRNMHADHLSAL